MPYSRRMYRHAATRFASLGLLACLCISASVARADTYTKTTTDNPLNTTSGLPSPKKNQGYYYNPGGTAASGHDPNSNSYIAGTDSATNDIYRDFFSFSLSDFDLTGKQITGAKLTLSTFNISGPGNLIFHDVTTAADVVKNNNNNAALSTTIFNDLGDGKVYGSYNLTTADANKVVDFALSNDAITDIISKAGKSGINGYFTLGGEYLSNYTFGTSFNGGTQQLTITYNSLVTGAAVPEFGTVLSFGGFLGFGALTWARRRRLR